MNTDELNNWLATEVMGWHRQEEKSCIWVDDSGKLTGFNYLNEWHPDTDLNQARQCLDVMAGNISINRGYNGWCVEIKHYNKETACLEIGSSINKSMSLAICEAIKEALEPK